MFDQLKIVWDFFRAIIQVTKITNNFECKKQMLLFSMQKYYNQPLTFINYSWCLIVKFSWTVWHYLVRSLQIINSNTNLKYKILDYTCFDKCNLCFVPLFQQSWILTLSIEVFEVTDSMLKFHLHSHFHSCKIVTFMSSILFLFFYLSVFHMKYSRKLKILTVL